LRINSASLFALGFISMFISGGVSGFFLAQPSIDIMLHATYFVVGHFHLVMGVAAMFGIFAGTYFWFPKMTGRMLDERLGRWNFWTMFLGFNLAFLPMHLTGLFGMPRRIYTYADGMGWDSLNLITSIGSFVFAIGVLLFFINVFRSLKNGATAGANPWDAPTLEWSVSSPPPPYNFAIIPTVASRHPLWEKRLEEGGAVSSLDRGMLLDQGKETIGTSALDAAPDIVLEMPEDSVAPLLVAVGAAILFAGLLLKIWACVGAGGAVVAAALLLWLWPRRLLREREPAHG
jgi:heme/copper-type cytochrome/quinol oxidase subunit 1